MNPLDETVCPACGKKVSEPYITDEEGIQISIWAVAHYLAHLVHQREAEDDDDGPQQTVWQASDLVFDTAEPDATLMAREGFLQRLHGVDEPRAKA